jgi:hypothetical protein
MVTYEKLSRHPQTASSPIGMTLEAFDQLYAEFAVVHGERLADLSVTRRKGTPRQRAVGAGGKHRYDLRDRLLMTFTYNRPEPGRKKLHSLVEVMDAFPDVRLVIDAKEQRIERPKAKKDGQGKQQDRQKPYYSGKKKTHTLKNQMAVRPDGLIEAMSESVPGGQTHDLTLLRQTDLLRQLDEDEAAMLDKGYDGVQNDYPDKRLYLPFKARRNHPLTEEQKAYNRFLVRYRILVEHTLACVNRFQVLRQVYRHQRDEHTRLVRIVAGLVNRRIREKPLKVYGPAMA